MPNNVSPRIGVAWAPGDRQTVVRASGGLYFDRIPLRATSNALQRDGINYKVAVLSFGQAGAPLFPDVLPSFPPDLVTAITTIDPAYPERPQRAVRPAGRAGDRRHAVGDRRLLLSARTRHHHVAQHQRADAHGGTGRRARSAEPGPAQPELREHQPVRVDWRLVVQRPDVVARDRVRRPGDGAACRTRCRRRSDDAGQRVLQHAAGQFRHPWRQGTVGQRSAASPRGQRHRRRRRRTAPPSVARWPVFQLGYVLLVRDRCAVQCRDRQRPQQRHDRQRSSRSAWVATARDSRRTTSFDLRVSRSFALGAASGSRRWSRRSTCSTT